MHQGATRYVAWCATYANADRGDVRRQHEKVESSDDDASHKRPGCRSRKTHADFALDLINRWSECSCITD
eukprot:scaffold54630_cov29-Attheya_sp.AAC.2